LPISHNQLLISLVFHTATPPTHIYTLSLHDALPICSIRLSAGLRSSRSAPSAAGPLPASRSSWPRSISSCSTTIATSCGTLVKRSEEHTSELQSRSDLVCRLLLEKKKTADNGTRSEK